MKLNEKICDRARLARDPRFDGRFFIAVLSTGIYCRPICPSRTALRANVRYFPTAEEAVSAGFRPCLRCRPAAAPGTPAWSGTSATVTRALRLIMEGALGNQGITRLAGRLGMSSRHLNRLFQAHLGASPASVARTWRLTRADEALRGTRSPMSRVAAESGFRSVRRFNDAFRKRFGKPPSVLRSARPATGRAHANEYEVSLAFTPPYDWASQLAFFKSRAIPGVEEVDAGTYRRSFALDGRQGTLEVRLDAPASALKARIHFGNPVSLLEIVRRLRIMFDVSGKEASMRKTARLFGILFGIVLSAAVCREASAETPKPSPCADAEHHRLDFWAGDWDTYEADEPTKWIARTHVDPIVGGCALLETYEQNDGLVGKSFTLYDAARKVWNHTWVTNRGSFMVLEGNFKDAVLSLEGPVTSLDGVKKTVRDVWISQPDGGVRETAEISVDGGKTWKPFFDVVFRKHKTGVPAPR